jgi:predicted acylesterase/phospholipase RssA
MKAAVISGGGAWGAFSVGTLSALQKRYDIVAGVSTGSLMAPLVALGEWERLIEAYTSVNQKDIFTYNPFRKSGKLSWIKAFWRVINFYETVGDSTALRRTIDKFLTIQDYDKLRFQRKLVTVACQEMRHEPEAIEHFTNLKVGFEDFKDFMWASANSPIAMSILKKGDYEYTDAGVSELLSLCRVLDIGAKEVDVFIHRPRPEKKVKSATADVIHNFFRLFTIMRKAIEADDLEQGLLRAQLAGAKVNVCWLPRKLSENSLLFDKKVMQQWVNEGMVTANDASRWDCYDYSSS